MFGKSHSDTTELQQQKHTIRRRESMIMKKLRHDLNTKHKDSIYAKVSSTSWVEHSETPHLGFSPNSNPVAKKLREKKTSHTYASQMKVPLVVYILVS